MWSLRDFQTDMSKRNMNAVQILATLTLNTYTHTYIYLIFKNKRYSLYYIIHNIFISTLS